MANILVVDDFPGNSRLVASMLRYLNHYITATRNGAEALNHIYTNRVDLIITDIDMPVMDGITLCKEIRQHPEYYRTPVIMLSAHHASHVRFTALQAGADGYLTKPIYRADLVAAVTEALERNSAEV